MNKTLIEKNNLQALAKAARLSLSDGGLMNKNIFMFYVYLIQSINFSDKTYIGYTDNLKERLATHDSGGSIYTKNHRPWKLVMFLGFDNKLKATAFEKYLKSGAGRVFAQKRFW